MHAGSFFDSHNWSKGRMFLVSRCVGAEGVPHLLAGAEQSSQQRIRQPQMSIVPRSRKPDLGQVTRLLRPHLTWAVSALENQEQQ